jgi:hypothetical protein
MSQSKSPERPRHLRLVRPLRLAPLPPELERQGLAQAPRLPSTLAGRLALPEPHDCDAWMALLLTHDLEPSQVWIR